MTNKKDEIIFAKLLRVLVYILRLFIYIIIQIVFIPFAIVGLIIGIYKEMWRSHKLGISFSAGQALQYRWIMHYFDTRPDPLSVSFTKKFPCESHFGLWTVMGALIISQKVFGFKTRLGKLVEPGMETIDTTAGIRVLMFDRIMTKYIDEMEQIVFPGAGFDLVNQRYTKGKNVKVYELDQVNTINMKVETLKKARIEHDWITYIPVDYSKESWLEKLLEAGFDKTKKTLFVWQSVSLYLEDSLVEDTLVKMASLCTTGSVIAQDFYSKAFLDGSISKTASKQMNLIGRLGEPWKFSLDMSDDPEYAVKSFLSKCGLNLTEYNQFGKKLNSEPFYCIVESEIL